MRSYEPLYSPVNCCKEKEGDSARQHLIIISQMQIERMKMAENFVVDTMYINNAL